MISSNIYIFLKLALTDSNTILKHKTESKYNTQIEYWPIVKNRSKPAVLICCWQNTNSKEHSTQIIFSINKTEKMRVRNLGHRQFQSFQVDRDRGRSLDDNDLFRMNIRTGSSCQNNQPDMLRTNKDNKDIKIIRIKIVSYLKGPKQVL